jgi:hypothetical protein
MNILRFPPISHAVKHSSAKLKNASSKSPKASKPARIVAALLLFGIMISFIPAVWADHETQPADNDKKLVSYAAPKDATASVPASATVVASKDGNAASITVARKPLPLAFWDNFRSNLFKPLLLFFYLGFAISLLKIAFASHRPIFQGLTIYLLISIGWHGGEELSALTGGTMTQALSFMAIGFFINVVVGLYVMGFPASVASMLQRYRRSMVSTPLERS